MNVIKNERGNAMGWIFTIILLIVVGIGAYLSLIRFSILPAPEALAEQSWMKTFLPPVDEDETTLEVEFSLEDNLRNQMLVLKSERDVAQTRITTLEQQLADQQSLVQEREDEIARLQNALNLAADRNIQNVSLIHENMDPKESAAILANMGAQSASLILGQMRESKAASVLEVMDEAIATEITEIMAGLTGEESETTPGSTPSEPTNNPV